jgi:hypothetical protein
MGHAEIDAAPQGSDRAVAIAAIDIPGALPDRGHQRTAFAELLLSQVYLYASGFVIAREAILGAALTKWIASSLTLLAMTTYPILTEDGKSPISNPDRATEHFVT